MSVADKVKSIIVEQLGVDESEVTPGASFTDDLGGDSLDIVELVMAFEEEFGIEIPDDEAENIGRVSEAIAYIEKHAEAADDGASEGVDEGSSADDSGADDEGDDDSGDGSDEGVDDGPSDA